MTRGEARRPTILWIIPAAILLATYVFLSHHLDARRQALDAQAARLDDMLRSNETLLREEPLLERRQAEYRAVLAPMQRRPDPGGIAAAWIGELTRAAAQHHVTVSAIESARDAPEPFGASASSAAAASPFERTALDVTMIGRYRGLLAACRDLHRGPILARVRITAIERDANLPEAALRARFRVILQRLAPPLPDHSGAAHVLARPS